MGSRTQLADLLSDLTVVRPSLVARRADLEAERFQRVQHAYAVDTNILYFIGQPISQILSQEKQKESGSASHVDPHRRTLPHTGSLFRDDPQHYHVAIGVALAQFIGFELSGTKPLLLPDALWPEAQTLLAHFSAIDDEATMALADELAVELQKKAIGAIQGKLVQSDVDPTDLANLIKMMVHQRVGRQEGLRQIRSLFDGGLIEKLSARPILGLNYLLRLSVQPQKLGDVQTKVAERRQVILDRWKKELQRQNKQEPHLSSDASALTQIELRNRIAHEENSNERTLFLTLDSAVTFAAEAVHVEHLNCTFAEAFVRHPAAFLNDIGLGVSRTSAVEQRTESESTSILDWIDVMVNKSSQQVETPTDDVAEEQRTAELVVEIQKGWADLSAIQEDQLLVQLGIEQIERSVSRTLEADDVKVALARLRDEVIEREADAWKDCFRIAIQLALNVEKQSNPTRSSPPIRYEGWPNANEAIEQFKVWGSYGLSSTDDFEAIRTQLENGEDKSGYSYFLGSAAFFAARGDWAPAAGLASFARELAYRRDVQERRGANGREAAYLEAVARQHLVRHPEDLARADQLIKECEQILEREEAHAGQKLDIVPERFKLEAIDIEHVRLLFRWDANEDLASTRQDMEGLFWRYRRLQLELEKQVDQRIPDIRTPLSLGGLEYVLVQTEIRTIISAFLLVAIGEIRMSESMRGTVLAMLGRLSVLNPRVARRRKGGGEHPTQDSSVLAQLAFAAVSALAAKAGGRRPNYQLTSQARQGLRERGVRSHYTFPFDERRFDAILRAFAKEGSN